MKNDVCVSVFFPDCCVHCILACLFCEFLTFCNIVLDCATCGSCAGDDACFCCCCATEECGDCDLPCDMDCGIIDACCESADCLEICMECCSLCFSSWEPLATAMGAPSMSATHPRAQKQLRPVPRGGTPGLCCLGSVVYTILACLVGSTLCPMFLTGFAKQKMWPNAESSHWWLLPSSIDQTMRQ